MLWKVKNLEVDKLLTKFTDKSEKYDIYIYIYLNNKKKRRLSEKVMISKSQIPEHYSKGSGSIGILLLSQYREVCTLHSEEHCNQSTIHCSPL